MELRPYEAKDIERIVELYNETVKEINWKDLTSEQKKVMFFNDTFSAHKRMCSNITIVLEDLNQIMGFVMMTAQGYINFLYVDQKHLNKKYGKNLLLTIEYKAKELGLEKVYLYASDFTAQNKIYEKLGYTNFGIETYNILGVEFKGNRLEKNLF